MSYSYEGFYVDHVALMEFATKQNPRTPPGKALNALYEFCEKTGKILDLAEAFTDTHSSWFRALDQAGKALGISERLSFSNIISPETLPFPYPHNEEICFGYLAQENAEKLADKLDNVETLDIESPDPEEVRRGLILFRKCCRKACSDRKDIVFIPLDYLDDEMESEVSVSEHAAVSPYLGQIKFLATVLSLPGIGYYLGAMQLGPLVFGKISPSEFATKWQNLFALKVGYFLMILPLIFYALILTMVWGKIAYKIRKRLWLGALLMFVFSYMALGQYFGGLVKNEGLALLAGSLVLWMSREK